MCQPHYQCVHLWKVYCQRNCYSQFLRKGGAKPTRPSPTVPECPDATSFPPGAGNAKGPQRGAREPNRSGRQCACLPFFFRLPSSGSRSAFAWIGSALNFRAALPRWGGGEVQELNRAKLGRGESGVGGREGEGVGAGGGGVGN
ncbi:probable monogalactosyldiacylglycerol synthase 1, chloroplastic [Dromiciops gliroides]|uniref:probable monogalactosyldiacylglycerol synthase 1, chloroplastic n=1 Tax=Dromiciops gliroides TaxID=33562 RepID=UPI001CC35EBC|nr:probable monogalactosyldiacylglycerol synthase 1, chloroplastic [Dromiciops gliroides]